MAAPPLQTPDLSMIPFAPPPTGRMANLQNPITLADTIVATSATTMTLAIFMLGARLYSTLRVTRSAGYDDLACISAMVFSSAYAGLVIHTKEYSRHGWDLPLSYFTGSLFKIIISEFFLGALGLLFSKLSILLLYFRLFSSNIRFRNLIYVGILWTMLINVTSIIVCAALCAPRRGESFGNYTSINRCAQLGTWALVQGSLNVVLDFYILYLPVPVLWSLKLNRKRKLGVLAIFMTGMIACVASILGLAYKARLVQDTDTFWNANKVDILNIVEINVAIMVASMPACASLFRYVFSQSRLVSSIKSRLFSSGTSTRTSQLKFWRLRGTSDLESAPPQITSVKGHSGHTLLTKDFEVFEEERAVST